MFVRKFKFILMKMHKKLLPPELLLLAKICTKLFVDWILHCRPHWESLPRSPTRPPEPLAGLRGGDPRGKRRKEGRGKRIDGKGREGKKKEGKGE